MRYVIPISGWHLHFKIPSRNILTVRSTPASNNASDLHHLHSMRLAINSNATTSYWSSAPSSSFTRHYSSTHYASAFGVTATIIASPCDVICSPSDTKHVDGLNYPSRPLHRHHHYSNKPFHSTRSTLRWLSFCLRPLDTNWSASNQCSRLSLSNSKAVWRLSFLAL